jgi:hypothetical protein
MAKTKDCKNCGKLFKPKRESSLFCKDTCRAAYSRRKVDLGGDDLADLKKQLSEIEKKLDFVIGKLGEANVGVKPQVLVTKTTTAPKEELIHTPRKKTVMDYAKEITKLQFDEEYSILANEIRNDVNLNEKQKTALIASMNCPNL